MNVEKQQEQVAEQEKEQTEQWNPDKDENNENNALFTIFIWSKIPNNKGLLS
jgi:hypothetical protein